VKWFKDIRYLYLATFLSVITFFGRSQIERIMKKSALWVIEAGLVKGRAIVYHNFYLWTFLSSKFKFTIVFTLRYWYLSNFGTSIVWSPLNQQFNLLNFSSKNLLYKNPIQYIGSDKYFDMFYFLFLGRLHNLQ
jgi:hypothetical protein